MDEINELRGAVEKLYELAQVALQQEDTEEAKEKCCDALAIQQRIVALSKGEFDENIMAVLLSKIALLGGTKEYQAIKCFKKAIDIWQSLYETTGKEEYKRNEEAIVKKFLTGGRVEQKLPEFPLEDWDMEELSKIAIQLGCYDVLCNDQDEIMIVVPHKLTPDNAAAKFYYDGGDHGILVKNKSSIVVCDEINHQIRALLYTRKELLFLEKEDGLDHELEFMVPLVQCHGVEVFANRLLRRMKNKRMR